MATFHENGIVYSEQDKTEKNTNKKPPPRPPPPIPPPITSMPYSDLDDTEPPSYELACSETTLRFQELPKSSPKQQASITEIFDPINLSTENKPTPISPRVLESFNELIDFLVPAAQTFFEEKMRQLTQIRRNV
jgi:hypothetical protein